MSRSMAYVAAAGGRSWKNAVSNTATCGRSGSALRATPMPSTAGGLCSGASGDSSSSLATNASSISVGAYSSGPAVHHPVPDRDQPGHVDARQLVEQPNAVRRPPRGRRSDRAVPLTVSSSPMRPRRSARRCRHHDPRIRLDDRVFHRRRSRVEHQNRTRHHLPCAWIAVMATVLTMSSTSAPRDRSLTGLFRPCSTGPIAIAPALRCTAL